MRKSAAERITGHPGNLRVEPTCHSMPQPSCFHTTVSLRCLSPPSLVLVLTETLCITCCCSVPICDSILCLRSDNSNWPPCAPLKLRQTLVACHRCGAVSGNGRQEYGHCFKTDMDDGDQNPLQQFRPRSRTIPCILILLHRRVFRTHHLQRRRLEAFRTRARLPTGIDADRRILRQPLSFGQTDAQPPAPHRNQGPTSG